MAKKISWHLSEQEKLQCQSIEEDRARFVDDYNCDIIQNLTLDQYVTGKGKENRTFCYCIECELKDYGDMRGANASKFGVWYGRYGEHTSVTYRHVRKYSKNNQIDEAFQSVKRVIVDLIEAGTRDDEKSINQSPLNNLLGDFVLRKHVDCGM